MSDDNNPSEHHPAKVDISERGGWLKDVDTTANAVKPGGLPSAQEQQTGGGDSASTQQGQSTNSQQGHSADSQQGTSPGGGHD
jgi:hypothetical protein